MCGLLVVCFGICLFCWSLRCGVLRGGFGCVVVCCDLVVWWLLEFCVAVGLGWWVGGFDFWLVGILWSIGGLVSGAVSCCFAVGQVGVC